MDFAEEGRERLAPHRMTSVAKEYHPPDGSPTAIITLFIGTLVGLSLLFETRGIKLSDRNK
jgi:hypothetical protein